MFEVALRILRDDVSTAKIPEYQGCETRVTRTEWSCISVSRNDSCINREYGHVDNN